MNAASFDRILRQVVFVPLFALLLAAGALSYQIRAASATVALIEGADMRMQAMLSIQSLLIDQETGLRGYEVTHNPAFLESYDAARQRLPTLLTQRLTIANDPYRHEEIRRLIQDYDTWQGGFAEPIIATVRAGGNVSDDELNLQGKRQMDHMRATIDDVNANTAHRRDLFIAQWHGQVRTTVLALLACALILGLVLGFYIRKLLQDVSAAFRQSHNVLRIRAEQTFRSEQRLRTTLQSIGDAVVTCDPQGRITSMNPVAESLTGWTQHEAHERALDDVFRILDETTREPIENPVDKVKRLNRIVAVSNHTILTRRDGTELFIDDSGSPIRDKHGKLSGVVLVFRDITVAKRSREALIANEKLAVAGRLAATIAHEIHNPLDSVANLLFLIDGQSTPEESAQFLELARGEIARVTQISRAMLSLYRESKAPVPIDLKEMLDSLLLLMERRFLTLNVTVTEDLPEDCIVHGFPAELRQVFTNLLTNAAEACGTGAGEIPGHIELRATPQAAQMVDGMRRETGVLVTVADNGPGIPEAIRQNLFNAFYTTKGERGTGLGLWVCRGIMTKHGGSIELESSIAPEDHGSVAKVFLATNPVLHPGGD